jgi:hypothetical protein
MKRLHQFDQGNFRKDSNPAGIPDGSYAPVDVQILYIIGFPVRFRIQTSPVFINVLRRTPSETGKFKSELRSVGMTR